MSSHNQSKIYPTSTPGIGIAVYENAWINPNQSIAELEEVVNDPGSGISFIESTVINDDGEGSVKSQGRTSAEIVMSKHMDNQYFKDFEDQCKSVINSCLESYREQMMISYNTFNIEGFYLLKYGVGEYFSSHYDAHSTNKRSISVLIYLNDDYEGGELEFVHFDLKIKPKAGTVILFPPNYPYRHIAHPVTSGTKYAVVTWYQER
jgi:predicted 2-oxoglutarate/Fe(II)-dependent dioxygenase YbiX